MFFQKALFDNIETFFSSDSLRELRLRPLSVSAALPITLEPLS